MRPAKKQRLKESFRKERSDGQNIRDLKKRRKGDNFPIYRLIKQFVDMGGPFSNLELGQMSSLLRQLTESIKNSDSSIVSDPRAYKELHTILLMRLGFTMPTLSSSVIFPNLSSISTCDSVDMGSAKYVLLMLQSLRELYKKFKLWSPLIQKDELRESLSIILQISEGIRTIQEESDNIYETKNKDISIINLLREINSECWLILDWMIDTDVLDRETLSHYDVQVEQLLMNLFRCVCLETEPTKGKVDTPTRTALPLVRKLQNSPLSDKIRQKATIVMEVVATMFRSADDCAASNNPHPFSEISSKQDRIFLWKCLTYCLDQPRLLTILDDSSVICELHSIILGSTRSSNSTSNAQSYELSLDAMDCLTHIARACLPSYEYKSIVQILIHVISGNANSELQGKALISLSALISTDIGAKTLLETELISNLLEASSNFACVESSMLNFAKIISRTFSYMVDQNLVETSPWLGLLSTLGAMLTSDNETIVVHSVDAIYYASRAVNSLSQYIVHADPNLISALASIALRDNTSPPIRHKVLKIFFNIIQEKDGIHVINLAREPRALEAIVESAAQHTLSESLARSRRLALSLILKLATNVSNRRILAKRVGLIPALIRYTRSRDLDQQDSDDDLLPGREELKQQILVLAKAL